MFGAKYSRLKFWIYSIILLILNIPVMVLSNSPTVNIEEADSGGLITIFLIFSLPTIIWINTLANRIRDYGSNPWLSLFSLLPIVNIGLALYYGIVQYKQKPINSDATVNDSNTSLAKAVYNHTKDLAAEVKPTISEYKQKHTSSQTQTEAQDVYSADDDKLYEQVMLELEEDRKIKATWARALEKADGDKDKTEALYIQFRVKAIKDEATKSRLKEEIIQRKNEEQSEPINEVREEKLITEKSNISIDDEYDMEKRIEEIEKATAGEHFNSLNGLNKQKKYEVGTIERFLQENGNGIFIKRKISDIRYIVGYHKFPIVETVEFIDNEWRIV